MSSIRFLIADESAAFHTFMRRLLEEYGFEPTLIQTTKDPAAALRVAHTLLPDFLLTDWFGNQSMNGLILYKEVLRTNANCQFALIGAGKTALQKQQADEAGALFFLEKPFTAPELQTALGKALSHLAQKHPKMAHHVNARGNHEASQRPAGLPHIPAPPVYRAGEQVLYKDRPATVKYVILRRGELVVQLQGFPGLVTATEIRKM